LKGIGRANVLALEADLRSLEQAALLFRTDDSAGAGNLEANVNNVALLARYTDTPSRFGDASHYGFIADSRGWWIGVAVSATDVAHDAAVDAAGSRSWIGSPNTMTPPGDAVFGANDDVVWRLLR
jgi:hypothetical protein